MLYPALTPTMQQQLYTENFIGLDRRPRTNDGAFADMKNMSGDPAPLLCTRKKRGVGTDVYPNPGGPIHNNGYWWISGSSLYFEDEENAVISNLSTDETMLPKQLVKMGAYVLVFPDGAYANSMDTSDKGYINRLYTAAGPVEFSLCAMDGTVYPSQSTTASDTAPQNPQNGDYWINTSLDTHALYQWSAAHGKWNGIATVYVKIAATGIGSGLKNQDSVTVSGIAYSGSNEDLEKQLKFLNNTHVIQAVGDDYIVVLGIIDASYIQPLGGVKADRKMPALDYVVESNNRLWGCHYGTQDGATVNEIYASALGDFRNWRKYLGTSQDSYAVSVGTEGPFTGAIAHNGTPYFFKEHFMHKIFGEKPSNYQVQTTPCDGVRQGCAGTLIAVNGMLYYVSLNGVMFMESLPQSAGDALEGLVFDEGCAGEFNGKYYLSAHDAKTDAWGLYVLDTERGLWWKEDASHAVGFARYQDELCMMTADGHVYAIHGEMGTAEADFDWYAETAVMGYEYAQHKYISRFILRVKLGSQASMRVKIQYDHSGTWESKGSLTGQGKPRTYMLPVIPRRCDSLQIRIEGTGEMQLYGFARIIEIGGDGMMRGRASRP